MNLTLNIVNNIVRKNYRMVEPSHIDLRLWHSFAILSCKLCAHFVLVPPKKSWRCIFETHPFFDVFFCMFAEPTLHNTNNNVSFIQQVLHHSLHVFFLPLGELCSQLQLFVLFSFLPSSNSRILQRDPAMTLCPSVKQVATIYWGSLWFQCLRIGKLYTTT